MMNAIVRETLIHYDAYTSLLMVHYDIVYIFDL